MTSILKVKGMSCSHCAMSIKKALGRLEGIQNVEVDLQRGEVRLENVGSVDLKQIQKTIEEAGYQVIQS